ncbi:beta-galactosidase [Nonomuraea candida]|uniref:beta-galactosidase n=1 Tax=Nonomuraea candida TaxID=359159 RepID=UPI000A7B9818|nr:beta-galactosidase [Nonomuraea candida]
MIPPPVHGHLRLGDPPDEPAAITVNSRHLSRAGRPWFPVSGEFHYARHPAEEWHEELLKMRAGGVTVVATYLFWNLHEERRGVFDWSGDRDLRRFVTTCAGLGLDVVARIGPWAHGESRNGGFPDWVVVEDCVPRTDDPRYLRLVRPWFAQIGARLRGLTRAAGGPVVAVQVENELPDQPGHLLTLKRMAQECGIDAPLWTATGWGHVRLPPGELIPLFGGYPEAAWDTAHDGRPAQSRTHYFFGPGRDDDSIGADLRPAGDAAADDDESRLALYPFATCELGGGMYTSYHRRPVVTAADVAALALVKLGSGSVWQGYYMYHGGSQRIGELSTLQESHATGYPNDCPVIDYDFQAPLGAYGQFRDSYRHLRLQHLWLACDGPDLATMTPFVPPDAPRDTADREVLRWAVRSDGRSGFLFVNNHQPAEPLPAHEGVRFAVELGGRELVVPREPVTVPSGAYFVWPLARAVGESVLLTATAQPVCVIDAGEPVHVFTQTAGIPVELVFDAATVADVEGPASVRRDGGEVVVSGLAPGTGCLLRVTGPSGGRAAVLVLDHDSALTATRGRLWGADRLVLSDGPAVIDDDRLIVYGESPAVRIFPAPDPMPVAPDPVTAVPDPVPAASNPVPADPGHGPTAVDPMPAVQELGRASRGGRVDGVFGVVEPPAPAGPPPRVRVEAVKAAGPARPPVIDPASGRASAPTDADFDHAAVYRITVGEEAFAGDGEVLLRLDWTGDVGRAHLGGRLVADQFWHGQVWEIGLRRFREEILEHGLELRLLPLREHAPVYVSPHVRPAAYPDGEVLELRSVTLVPMPRTVLPARP